MKLSDKLKNEIENVNCKDKKVISIERHSIKLTEYYTHARALEDCIKELISFTETYVALSASPLEKAHFKNTKALIEGIINES